jgi:hypothetical protein
MTSATASVPGQREPELAGQTVVLIGGSAGIGLETARRARAEGAEVILAGRDRGRLGRAAASVGAARTSIDRPAPPQTVPEMPRWRVLASFLPSPGPRRASRIDHPGLDALMGPVAVLSGAATGQRGGRAGMVAGESLAQGCGPS